MRDDNDENIDKEDEHNEIVNDDGNIGIQKLIFKCITQLFIYCMYFKIGFDLKIVYILDFWIF